MNGCEDAEYILRLKDLDICGVGNGTFGAGGFNVYCIVGSSSVKMGIEPFKEEKTWLKIEMASRPLYLTILIGI